jgi:transcription elongation factor Elf1
MSHYLDVKYVNMLKPYLLRFKAKQSGVWEFRCPFCKDSKKDPRKARGYVFTTPKRLLFKCQNCGKSTTISKLIKHVAPVLYQDYAQEKLLEDYTPQQKVKFEVPKPTKVDTKIVAKGFSDLTPIDKLPNGHSCRLFVESRKIPKQYMSDLYYIDNFYAWTNTLIPRKFSEKALAHDAGRLVIPLVSKDNEIFGYQGRQLKDSLDTKAIKYYTIILDESKPKIWGLNTVDQNRTFYILEGPIDAMFIPNSVAVCGGDLWSVNYHMNMDNAVFVFDNEPRHPDTTKKMRKAMSLGYRMVIWPSSITEKDINDMVVEGGLPIDYVQRRIKKCTYDGLEAELQFSEWSKR